MCINEIKNKTHCAFILAKKVLRTKSCADYVVNSKIRRALFVQGLLNETSYKLGIVLFLSI